MIDFIVGIALLGTIAVVMAELFRTTMTASLRTTSEAAMLSNARIAIDGNGPFHGLLFDTAYSSYVYSGWSSSMTLTEIDQSTTSFSLDSTGDFLVGNSSNPALAGYADADGLSNLSMAYYSVDSNFHFSSTTAPSAARLVTFSFKIARTGRTGQFYSGSVIRNHP